MKKLLSLLVSLMMFLALTVPAYASNRQSPGAVDTCTAPTSINPQAVLHNVQPFGLQNVGDTCILMEDEDGIVYIELVDKRETVSNDVSRGVNRVTTATDYDFKYKNWLGQEKVGVTISAYAEWIEDGYNSKITNLHGDYVVKNSSCSCVWDEERKYASDYWHSLALDIYHETSLYGIALDASLVASDDPKVLVTISQYYP